MRTRPSTVCASAIAVGATALLFVLIVRTGAAQSPPRAAKPDTEAVIVQFQQRTYRIEAGDRMYSSLKAWIGKQPPPSIVPPSPPDGPGSDGPPVSPPKRDPDVQILLAAALASAAGTLLWFKVLVPYRRRRPLREALAELADPAHETPELLARVEERLSTALGAGLSPADVADARFARSFVRARLNELDGAAADVAELRRSERNDADSAYLELWLLSRRSKTDQIIQMSSGEEVSLVKDILDARLAFGMALLQRGSEYWRQREMRQAIRHFEMLREMGVLLDQIPSQIEEHEVVLGTQALFQQDVVEARKFFTAAVQTAERKEQDPVRGQLGLLLCDWQNVEVRADLAPKVEELAQRLLTACGHIQGPTHHCSCSECMTTYVVWQSYADKKIRCRSCGNTFSVVLDAALADTAPVAAPAGAPVVADAADPSPAAPADQDDLARPEPVVSRLLDDNDLQLRNVLLWQCVALVESWRHQEPGTGLADGGLTTLHDYVEQLRSVDPMLPDGPLIEGLIRYYFAASVPERDFAFGTIQHAIDAGVSHPAILDFARRHTALVQRVADAREAITQLVRVYLMDAHVDLETRKALLAQVRERRAFADLRIELADRPSGPPPTAQELLMRSTHVQRRINDYLAFMERDPLKRQRIARSVEALTAQAGMLKEAPQEYSAAEGRIVGLVAQEAFAEEEPPFASDGASGG